MLTVAPDSVGARTLSRSNGADALGCDNPLPLPQSWARALPEQQQPVPVFVYTNNAPVATALDEVRRAFDQLDAHDALGRWRAAHRLLSIYEAGLAGTGERLTQKEIARRLQRSTAHSIQGPAEPGATRERRKLRDSHSTAWVGHALRAARRWPAPPQTAQERADFLADFYGNPRRSATAAGVLDAETRSAGRRFTRALTELAFDLLPDDLRAPMKAALTTCEALLRWRAKRRLPAPASAGRAPAVATGEKVASGLRTGRVASAPRGGRRRRSKPPVPHSADNGSTESSP